MIDQNNNTNFRFMLRRYFGVLMTFLIVMGTLPALPARAVINEQIPFTATLLTSAGVAVADGNYDFTIRLYDAAAAGTCLWSASGTCGVPTQITLTVTDGVFSVVLGGAAQMRLLELILIMLIDI